VQNSLCVQLLRSPILAALLRGSDEFCDIELTGFDVIASNTRARFFVVYRPPKQDVNAVKYMKKLVNCLSNYQSKKYTNIILGDFNLPKLIGQIILVVAMKLMIYS